MGPLGELGALFNPGMRHEIEERKSKANRREEEGNARDGDLRIDLASGVAVINLGKNGEAVAAPAKEVAAQQEPVAGEPEVADDADRASTLEQQGPAGDRDLASGPTADTSPAEPDAAGSTGGTAESTSAAQARRVAAAARRSARGDRPARPETPRPANAQLPSSKASRAAR